MTIELLSHELAALQAGRLSQIRRPVEDWPPEIRLPRQVRADWPFSVSTDPADPGVYRPKSNSLGALCVQTPDGKWLGVKPSEFEWVCPYGAPGDVLRVLEEWAVNPVYDALPAHRICKHGWEPGERVAYRADGEWPEHDVLWRPADTMPEWASRYFLDVTAVDAQKAGTEWTWVISVQQSG